MTFGTGDRHSPRTIELSHIAPTPWRNGKGTTRELIAWPDAQDWMLRFSIADIDNDGPFSPWPGVTRDFVVLDGAGVVLHWQDGHEERMTPGREPLRFDGADAPRAQLIDGPTRDLNLMTRDGCDARLQLGDDRQVRRRPWGCFAAEDGRVTVDNAGGFDVPAMTLVWFDDAAVSASFDRRCWWIVRGASRYGA